MLGIKEKSTGKFALAGVEEPEKVIRTLFSAASGTWSGNVFDFYRKVSPKLMADLKVPFKLSETALPNATG